jgi:Rps23 Pro-64 3,4-dihydroxylase Tpa1-like proline 4-hydroxylase
MSDQLELMDAVQDDLLSDRLRSLSSISGGYWLQELEQVYLGCSTCYHNQTPPSKIMTKTLLKNPPTHVYTCSNGHSVSQQDPPSQKTTMPLPGKNPTRPVKGASSVFVKPDKKTEPLISTSNSKFIKASSTIKTSGNQSNSLQIEKQDETKELMDIYLGCQQCFNNKTIPERIYEDVLLSSPPTYQYTCTYGHTTYRQPPAPKIPKTIIPLDSPAVSTTTTPDSQDTPLKSNNNNTKEGLSGEVVIWDLSLSQDSQDTDELKSLYLGCRECQKNQTQPSKILLQTYMQRHPPIPIYVCSNHHRMAAVDLPLSSRAIPPFPSIASSLDQEQKNLLELYLGCEECQRQKTIPNLVYQKMESEQPPLYCSYTCSNRHVTIRNLKSNSHMIHDVFPDLPHLNGIISPIVIGNSMATSELTDRKLFKEDNKTVVPSATATTITTGNNNAAQMANHCRWPEDAEVIQHQKDFRNHGLIVVKNFFTTQFAKILRMFVDSKIQEDAWNLHIFAPSAQDPRTDTEEKKYTVSTNETLIPLIISDNNDRSGNHELLVKKRWWEAGQALNNNTSKEMIYRFYRLSSHSTDCNCVLCNCQNTLKSGLFMEYIDTLCQQHTRMIAEPLRKSSGNFVSRFRKGSFLGIHSDQGRGRIGFIYVLTKQWTTLKGGLFSFMSSNLENIQHTIIPEFNSFILFYIDRQHGAPHFISQIADSVTDEQFLISGWFD